MLFDRLKKKEEIKDNEIVAPISGSIVPLDKVNDAMFREEMMGQTLAIRPELNLTTMVAPVSGTLEVMFPTGHAYAVRMADGTGVLIHVGIDTVNLKGKGFKPLAKAGDVVKAGDPIVKVDFVTLEEKGYDYTVMMILTDADKRIDYTCNGVVKKNQKIAVKQ